MSYTAVSSVRSVGTLSNFIITTWTPSITRSMKLGWRLVRHQTDARCSIATMAAVSSDVDVTVVVI